MKKSIFAIIFVMFIFLAWCNSEDNKYNNLDEFATCLSQKWIIMYGTDTCSFCQKQKKSFGDSFKNINFVNCSKDPNKCSDAGVRWVPHRSYPDGTSDAWLQSLETLSQKSSCELK